MLVTQSRPLVNIEDCQYPLISLGGGYFTIIDPEDLPWAQEFDWRAIKSAGSVYALRREVHHGHYTYFRLHRELMQCPDDLEVHHINGNSLDNRRSNLVCVTSEEHKKIHNCL
jgi:hypothetical protein